MQKGTSHILNLCRIGVLTNDYNHTIDFENKTNQLNYFVNARALSVTGNYILDSNRTVYLVNLEYESLVGIDYMYCIGDDGKTYYYFVNGIEYKTKSNSLLYVELDVFQTFMFNFSIKNSFVDRCHVPRWNSDGTPTREIVPEDLQLTTHEIMIKDTIYDYGTKGAYIITSTEPLGSVPYRRENINGTGGNNNNNNSNGNWKQGYMSSNGFRFLKGHEGFGKYAYGDSANNKTLAYGITLHGCPTEYNELLPLVPLDETIGAKKSYEVSQKYYGSKIVNRCLELGITKTCEFDALIDLAYNCGIGVITSDNSLTRAIKSKTNIKETWEKFYISDGINTLPGLITRRKQEVDIFLNNNYVFRDIGIFNSNGVNIGTVTENNKNGWLPTDKNNDNDNDTGLELTVENQYGKGYKPTTGTCSATWPKYSSGSRHTGVDIANSTGTKIYCWRSGTVRIAGTGAGYGLGIVVDHDDKTSTAIYGHSSTLYVKTGDHVTTGQLISLMGSTGNSTGPHLHFEIRPYQGAYLTDVNPWYNLKLNEKV